MLSKAIATGALKIHPFTAVGAPEEPRRRFGRYESICEIASGGMATVYLARDLTTNRLAAVKALHPHLMADADVVQNFVDENHIVSRICHRNVVPVLEVAQNDAGYYQAMEYVDGAPLGRLLVHCIRGGHWLSIPACVRVALDVLEGLDAAHELKNNAGELTGVVHRDVGPANILVDVFGMARVIDFGVATMTVRYTAPGSDSIKGRLAYMAPEQAKTPKDVDRRADIFAVGVVLWELLAARRLFKGKSEAETLQNLLGLEIPALGIIREDVEPELDAIVARALERDPSRRFQTARELIIELRAAVPVDDAETRGEISELVGAAVGEELEQRRALAHAAALSPTGGLELSRAWVEKSSVGPGATVASIAPPSSLLSSPPPARKRWPWVAALLLLLAGGAWFGLMRQGPRVAEAAAESSPESEPTTVQVVPASSVALQVPESQRAELEPSGEPPPPAVSAPASGAPVSTNDRPPRAVAAPAPRSGPAVNPDGARSRRTPSKLEVDLSNPYR